jgi:hypothetical protein
MIVRKASVGAAVLTLVGAIGYGGYSAGQHNSAKIKYYSEMMEKTTGTKRYLIDGHVQCSNGKDLGLFQVDMDLRSGKLIVVRLDNRLTPDCYLDHPILPQVPQYVPPPPPPPAPTPAPVPSVPVKK